MVDVDKIKEDLDETLDGLIKGFNEQFEKSNKDFEKRSQEKLDRLLEEEKKIQKHYPISNHILGIICIPDMKLQKRWKSWGMNISQLSIWQTPNHTSLALILQLLNCRKSLMMLKRTASNSLKGLISIV